MVDDKLLCCKDERLVSVDAKTLRGETDILGVKGGCIVATEVNGKVIVGANNDRLLYSLDRKTLREEYKIDNKRNISSLFKFNDDCLVVGSYPSLIDVYKVKDTHFERLSKEGGEKVGGEKVGGYYSIHNMINISNNTYAASG